jgi:hypothetical protein
LGSSRAQHDAPLYDADCQAAKARLRAFLRSQPARDAASSAAENQYHSLVRRKKRAWQRQELQQLLQQLHSEPRAFWKRVNSQPGSMPQHLQDPAAWDAYLQLQLARPIRPGCFLPLTPAPAPPAALVTAAEFLNLDISSQDVMDMLQRLQNGRATGGAQFPAEFLRYAVAPRVPGEEPPSHQLGGPLCALLNAAFTTGKIPDAWTTSLVTPILKRGDPADTANYRPIAVGNPLVRLYAAVLNNRLVSFLEGQRLRAPTQAGFRPALSVNHHLFALQHIIDRRIHRPRGRPPALLYCCFVDLTAAYDCIQRPLLWEALRRHGVHGRMLRALQSLYADAHIAIKVGGRIGAALASLIDVRQGCPGSPTEFGCTLDGLPAYLDEHAPDAGVLIQVGDRDELMVSHLMYADDIVLLGHSPADLQRLVDAFAGFCEALGLDVSPAKTQTMCFGLPAGEAPPGFTYSGRALPAANSYKYLGVTFTPAGSAADGLPRAKATSRSPTTQCDINSIGLAVHGICTCSCICLMLL